MKKRDIIDLIRYHAENNDIGFRNAAYKIANEFDAAGDGQLAGYISSLLSNNSTFIPQNMESKSVFFEKIEYNNEILLLPDDILQDLYGVMNAVEHHIGINKFLFQGAPGTGKTEAVKQLSKILNRDVYMVNFTSIIDSKLGQTQKNMVSLFTEINNFYHPGKVMILFDEIDAIALDRTNDNDIREMGRTTSEFLKLLDRINEDIVIVATTNLYKYLDKAIIRRFDSVIDFDRYSRKDLMDIAERMLDSYLHKLKLANRDIRLFRKILNLAEALPMPGDIKNIIKTSLAFSDINNPNDYLVRLYTKIYGEKPDDIALLKKQGFTVREIEKLTNTSKSSVSRLLNKEVK